MNAGQTVTTTCWTAALLIIVAAGWFIYFKDGLHKTVPVEKHHRRTMAFLLAAAGAALAARFLVLALR